MKPFIAGLVVLMAAGGAVAAEPDLDQLAKDAVSLMKEMRGVLTSIKDKETAEAARPKLEDLFKSSQKLEKSITALPKQEAQAFAKKHRAAIEPLQKDIEKELVRIQSLPKAFAVVRSSSIFKMLEDAKEAVAALSVAKLTLAAVDFKLRHGEFPTSLAVLTESDGKKPPLLEKADLIDPWGRTYKYDLTGPKNGGKKPDIWSEGSPSDKGKVIGNWTDDKKPPKN